MRKLARPCKWVSARESERMEIFFLKMGNFGGGAKAQLLMISLSIYTANNNAQAFQVGQDTVYDNLLKRNHPRTREAQACRKIVDL